MTIDRIAPRTRPPGPPAGYQSWRSLLFLHWEVPADLLASLIPDGLSLDLFDGTALVGVVPFLMRHVRPRWCPKALGFNFLETNVRTYVHRNGQPGVYFFSLEASSRLAVWAARRGWGLPYFYARMHYERQGDQITYTTRRSSTGERHQVRYTIGDPLAPSAPDSLEYFLLERYLLFVRFDDGRLYAGQVHHAPYPAQHAEVLDVDDQLMHAAGLPQPLDPPRYAHYSDGVDVEVFALRQC